VFWTERKATFTRDGVLKMFKRAAEAAALPFPMRNHPVILFGFLFEQKESSDFAGCLSDPLGPDFSSDNINASLGGSSSMAKGAM
jgi:hypothetical protein